MTDTLAPFRRGFRYVAVACSLASALFTLNFGLAQSDKALIAVACAAFLVACSLASDYVALVVSEAWQHGRRITAAMLTGGAVFVFSLNLLSNVGSVGWHRDSTITAATLQATRYDDRRDAVTEARQNLGMWSDRLAKLEAEHAWSATVTADALRAQLESANLAIEQEARRGGCGPRCLERTRERDQLAARIAIAEEAGNLRSQIEATKRLVDQAREAAHGTQLVVAAPQSQARFFASLASMDLAPSAEAQTWTDRTVAIWLAIGLCVAPVLFGMIGWGTLGTRRHDDEPPTGMIAANDAPPATRHDTQPPAPYIIRQPKQALATHTIAQLRAIAA
jgi:hypothetical protein